MMLWLLSTRELIKFRQEFFRRKNELHFAILYLYLGMILDDDTSLSSGGDVLSTHSTPAVLNGNPAYPHSAMLSRKSIPTESNKPAAHVKR